MLYLTALRSDISLNVQYTLGRSIVTQLSFLFLQEFHNKKATSWWGSMCDQEASGILPSQATVISVFLNLVS